MKKSITSLSVLFFAALFMGTGLLPATAQTTRKLVIRDGMVYLDGLQIDQEQVPSSLNVAGMEASLQFTGDVQPIIAFNNTYYRLGQAKISELATLPEGESAISIFVLDGGRIPSSPALFQSYQGHDEASVSFYYAEEGPRMAFMQHAESLYEQASELQRRAVQEARQPLMDMNDITSAIVQEAEHAAYAAEALPRLQVRSYLLDVQQNDAVLYERLLREAHMEDETRRLAEEIQQLSPGAQRDESMTKLRELLDEIFELKQQNRREEIEQLDARLNELQQHLQDREKMRQAIIDRRLNQLLEQSHQKQW